MVEEKKDETKEKGKYEISGIIILIIGLSMLLYSFLMAFNFVVGSFPIDETIFIRFIFLFCVILVGSYLLNKGATSQVNTKIIGWILLSLGLILLIWVFLLAVTFIIGSYGTNVFYTARLMFYFCMIGIGIFLTGRGYELKKVS